MPRTHTVTAPAEQPVLSSPLPLSFLPPPVEIGQVVLWTMGQGDVPSAALVVRVGQRTLSLAIHVDGVKDHILRNGVRHVDDPFLRQVPPQETGVWDLTPRDKLINDLLATFGTPGPDSELE